MKRKTLTIAISFFALIAIVSVGFASWVISRPEQVENKAGEITVETVDDSSLIEMTVTIDDAAIRFNHPETMSESNAWLTSKNETQTEKLTATITIKLSAQLGDDDTITLATSVTGDASKYAELTQEQVTTEGTTKYNYIGGIKLLKEGTLYSKDAVSLTTLSKTDFNESNECKIVVAFGWGEKFNFKNPYDYYNDLPLTNENAKDATETLAKIESDLAGIGYKVTITLPKK